MPKTAVQLDREITAHTASKHVDAINHALYRAKDPDALAAAVRAAQKHVTAMKRVARKPPKHPGSSYFVDSSGTYDPTMYELANVLVLAKQHVRNHAYPVVATRTTQPACASDDRVSSKRWILVT